ncbi:hypothetical protein EZV62_005496 [Acer yangbiense]|uniref:Uncharacterized protein n=1 Tax=Acer yangbiense TaxID=1000413 RepID=A0A5C7IMS3_9ROSI|nr:hypothetical protein EZV62_005496 [Acer yangbiense]
MSDTVDVHYRRRSEEVRHLIEIYFPSTALFIVYEMERDNSRWMVKYRVDLLSGAAAFPEMVRSHPLDIPNKAIRYNFKDKSFKKVHEFAPVGIEIEVESTLEIFNIDMMVSCFSIH